MRYIRQVEVEQPGTRNEHITAVRYSNGTAGALTTRVRAAVASDIDARLESYSSYNDNSGAWAPVVARTSRSGLRYLATVANGIETDNLLALPRFGN